MRATSVAVIFALALCGAHAAAATPVFVCDSIAIEIRVEKRGKLVLRERIHANARDWKLAAPTGAYQQPQHIQIVERKKRKTTTVTAANASTGTFVTGDASCIDGYVNVNAHVENVELLAAPTRRMGGRKVEFPKTWAIRFNVAQSWQPHRVEPMTTQHEDVRLSMQLVAADGSDKITRSAQ